MTEDEVLAYVKAAALALALPLDDARAQRVAGHLARSAEMARLLDAFPLQVTDEQAELYSVLPFPTAPGGRERP